MTIDQRLTMHSCGCVCCGLVSATLIAPSVYVWWEKAGGFLSYVVTVVSLYWSGEGA